MRRGRTMAAMNPLNSGTNDRSDLLNSIMRKSHPGIAYYVGANKGQMIPFLRERFGKIVAIEPVPAMMSEAMAANPGNDIVWIQKAVGANPGVIKDATVVNAWTLVTRDSLNDMIATGKHSAAIEVPEFRGCSMDIEVTTLDDVAKEHGDPEFVILDVDGHEMHALIGGTQMIYRSKPTILFEYSDLSKFHGIDGRLLVRWIWSAGYVMRSIDGSYTATTEQAMLDCYPHHTSFDVLLVPSTR